MGAALIAAFACPGPPAVLVERRAGVVRTTAVACDGDRRVVVRRARLRRGGPGTRIVAVAAAGSWVAWAELRWGRLRVRPVVSRRQIGRGPIRVTYEGRRRWRPPRIELVVTSRGGAGWLVGRAVYTTRGIGGSSLASSLEGARGPLVLEEDRTVRWHEPGGLLGFEDVHGAPCGPRPGYRVVAEDGQMLLTEAVYDGDLRVSRACLLGALEDPVILQRRGDGPELVGLDDPWALFIRTAEGACTVETYHPSYDGPHTRPVVCERAPAAGTPFAITSLGTPAWILEGSGRSALVMPVGARVLELDAAAPGGITALTSEGYELRWLHEGEPRSVVFHR